MVININTKIGTFFIQNLIRIFPPNHIVLRERNKTFLIVFQFIIGWWWSIIKYIYQINGENFCHTLQLIYKRYVTTLIRYLSKTCAARYPYLPQMDTKTS